MKQFRTINDIQRDLQEVRNARHAMESSDDMLFTNPAKRRQLRDLEQRERDLRVEMDKRLDAAA